MPVSLNLLQLLSADDQQTFTSKINFNFDEILSLGGGPPGDPGIQGFQGVPGGQGIQGQQGIAGINGTKLFIEPFDPVIMSPPPNVGDQWFNTSNLKVYTFNGAVWTLTGIITVSGVFKEANANTANIVFTTPSPTKSLVISPINYDINPPAIQGGTYKLKLIGQSGSDILRFGVQVGALENMQVTQSYISLQEISANSEYTWNFINDSGSIYFGGNGSSFKINKQAASVSSFDFNSTFKVKLGSTDRVMSFSPGPFNAGNAALRLHVGLDDAITNAASRYLTITNLGSVGVGVDPSANGSKMEIVTSTPTNPGAALGLLIRSTAAASYTSLRLYNDANQNIRSLEIDYAGSSFPSSLVYGGPVGESAAVTTVKGPALGNGPAVPLVLATNNTARIAIMGDGSVGIGDFTYTGVGPVKPTSRLVVSGGYKTTGITGSADQLQINTTFPNSPSLSPQSTQFIWGDNTGWKLHFGTNAAGNFQPRLSMVDTGYIGIGTTNPVQLLHISRDGGNAGGGVNLFVQDTNATYAGGIYAGTYLGNAYIQSAVSGRALAFWDASAEKMRILPTSGNVGIGITNPVGKLGLINQIDGGSALATYAGVSGVPGQSVFNSYYINLTAASGDPGPYARILDIASVGAPDGTNGGGVIRFLTNNVNANSSAVEHMRINSNGNVGINTISPAFTLDVNGAGRIANLEFAYQAATGSPFFNSQVIYVLPTSGSQTISGHPTGTPIYMLGGDSSGAGNSIGGHLYLTGGEGGTGSGGRRGTVHISGDRFVFAGLIGLGTPPPPGDVLIQENAGGFVGIGLGANVTPASTLELKGDRFQLSANTHIRTTGTAPSCVVVTGTGTTSIVGTDVAGIITMSIASSMAAGNQLQIAYTASYSAAGVAPVVILTPANNFAANAMQSKQIYAATGTTLFNVVFGIAPDAGTTYKFYYYVIQHQ